MNHSSEAGNNHETGLAMSGRSWKSWSWSAVASVLSGLGALGFLTVGRLAVGLAEFAPMAHVWTVWSISAATIGFGAQIETVENLTHRRAALSRRQLAMAIAAGTVVGGATFLWREALFGTISLFWPLVCALIPLGSLATGMARGALAAADRARQLAFVIAGENVVRLGGAVTVLWLGGSGRLLAWSLLAGFSVAIVGLMNVRSVGRSHKPMPSASSGGVGAFAGLVAHISLVLPPSVLALQGEDPEVVAAVFLVLTYVRAPYQFLLGMGPFLTAQSFANRSDGRRRLMSEGGRTLRIGLVSMAGVAAMGFLAGDWITGLIVGRGDIVSRLDLAILGALVVGIGVAVLRTLNLLARNGRRRVLRGWVSTAVLAAVAPFVAGTATSLFVTLLLGVLLCLFQLTIGPPASVTHQASTQ